MHSVYIQKERDRKISLSEVVNTLVTCHQGAPLAPGPDSRVNAPICAATSGRKPRCTPESTGQFNKKSSELCGLAVLFYVVNFPSLRLTKTRGILSAATIFQCSIA